MELVWTNWEGGGGGGGRDENRDSTVGCGGGVGVIGSSEVFNKKKGENQFPVKIKRNRCRHIGKCPDSRFVAP
jgi:hypothetical protein